VASRLPHINRADLSTSAATRTSPRFGVPRVQADPRSQEFVVQRHALPNLSSADSEYFEDIYGLDPKVAKLLADLKRISCHMEAGWTVVL